MGFNSAFKGLMRLFQFNILYSTQENAKTTMGKPVIGNYLAQTHCSLGEGVLHSLYVLY